MGTTDLCEAIAVRAISSGLYVKARALGLIHGLKGDFSWGNGKPYHCMPSRRDGALRRGRLGLGSVETAADNPKCVGRAGVWLIVSQGFAANHERNDGACSESWSDSRVAFRTSFWLAVRGLLVTCRR